MSERQKLQVDLTDIEDMRAKVSSAEELLKEKQLVLLEAEKEAEHWAGLVENLKLLAGIVTVDDSSAVSNRPSPAQDAVVRIVKREGRAMRPVEVADALKAEGSQVTSNNAVNAALYAAAEAGRIRRPGARQYAPLVKRARKKKASP